MFTAMWGSIVAALSAGAMNRAKFFVDKFATHMTSGETMLDLGCGSSHLGLYSKLRYGQQVTLADVRPPFGYIGQWLVNIPCATTLARRYSLPYVLYDGRHLPFADCTFDTVLTAFILHHADDPDVVLAEAIRVSRKRIVVFEDIPHSVREAKVNRFADSLVNLEFFGHPHGNRTEKQWEAAFRLHSLTTVRVESWVSKLFGMPFPNTMFVLEKGK